MKKSIALIIFSIVLGIPLFYATCLATEITILYTGETHSMIYPCNCPKESDGGVARRAALTRQIRKNASNVLLVDAGGAFGGGLSDEYTQSAPLDMHRTTVNLQTMALMQYDCLAVGNDEFNFGRQFLEEQITKRGLVFLSCNISVPQSENAVLGGASTWFKPYLVREIAGCKVGIIGVTSPSAAKKVTDITFTDPVKAVSMAVEALKQENANIIVLLGQLAEGEDALLMRQIKGIDVLIVAQGRFKGEPVTKVGNTVVARAPWQARQLGKLSVTIKDNQVVEYTSEQVRLSDEFKDDPQILPVLPRCFSDLQCKQDNVLGTCIEPGTMASHCTFAQAAKVHLLVIDPKPCIGCTTGNVVEFLKSVLPGITVSYLTYPGAKAQRLMKELDIQSLPAYLLDSAIEKQKGFEVLRGNAIQKGNFYMLKPSYSGMSLFPQREKVRGKLDLFVSLWEKDAWQVLENIRDFNPAVHFLVTEEKDGRLTAARGNLEVEECLRAVCVQKYYPQNFFDYIVCRSKNIESSWWQDCLKDYSEEKIEACARGQEGRSLLQANIQLNKELGVMFGPTYLWNNQDIFSSKGIPQKEEYRRIFSKK